jgi:hypothetical protein
MFEGALEIVAGCRRFSDDKRVPIMLVLQKKRGANEIARSLVRSPSLATPGERLKLPRRH